MHPLSKMQQDLLDESTGKFVDTSLPEMDTDIKTLGPKGDVSTLMQIPRLSPSKEFALSATEMQKHIIGLIHVHDNWYPVIELNEDVVKFLIVTKLLGVNVHMASTTYGKIVTFPENKSLLEMMQNPHDFNIWSKKHLKP